MKTEEIEIRRYRQHALPSRRDIVTLMFRHWVVMLLVAVLIVAGTVAIGLWSPKYEAGMKILVESRRTDATISSASTPLLQTGGNTVTEEDLNSEVELLTSTDLLRKVVLASGLAGKQPGDVAVARATRRLSRDLRVEAVRRTHVISIRYAAADPHLAVKVLSALENAYIEKHTEVHRSNGESAFFKQEAARFRQNLTQAQQRLEAFNAKRGVVSALAERDAALQRANDFESNARESQAQAVATQEQIGSLEAQLRSVPARLTTAVRQSDDPQLMSQLKSTLLTLQLKRTELLTKYAPTYPLVTEVEQQIKEATAAIAAAQKTPVRDETTDRNPNYMLIQDALNKARVDLSGLKARAASDTAIANSYRDRAARLGEADIQQQNLIRDAKTQEDAYLLYVRKSEEAGISDALDRRGIVNVSVAEEPTLPSLPRSTPLMALLATVLLVSFGSFSTAVAVDVFDPTFRTPDELAGYLETPVLAALPRGRG